LSIGATLVRKLTAAPVPPSALDELAGAPADEAIEHLASSHDGLTAAEAALRREREGDNELALRLLNATSTTLRLWSRSPKGRFVIEMAPIRDVNGAERGVVAEGAVGSRAARRFQLFRYEIRRWRAPPAPTARPSAD
jgi:hypothetical protein